jgi:serine/threonine-protein kinase
VSPTQSNVPVQPGDVIADKYRVERILGVGGMGFVVAARNVLLSKPVALKMMLPEALRAPSAVERFEREARAAVQLKSEHVAEVLDIGRLPNGLPFIVMELLEGADFEATLRQTPKLPVEQVVTYILQACEALAEAHALGIVHRDLKLRNLFLAHRLDGTPVVKVLDFGISKWTVADPDAHVLTRTSDVMGSPNYMSPEQVRSAKDVDARTDIWSLGVVLFELFTGRVPFVADTLPQLCAMVLEQPAPPLATLRTDLPPALAAIVARCLEKSPDRRFQSVPELAAALAPFGPARAPRISIGSEAVSPNAVTISEVGSSAPGPIGMSTSAPWSTSAFERKRLPPLHIAAIVAGGLLVSGAGLTAVVFGTRWPRPAPSAVPASISASPPALDASLASPVASLSAASSSAPVDPMPVPTPPPPPSVAAPAPVPPRPLGHVEGPVETPAHAQTGAPPPSAAPSPSRSAAGGPTGDPFRPVDRK